MADVSPPQAAAGWSRGFQWDRAVFELRTACLILAVCMGRGLRVAFEAGLAQGG